MLFLEGKRVRVWDIFVVLFKKQIDMFHCYGRECFDEAFVEVSGLISRVDGGRITYNFESIGMLISFWFL